MYYVGMDIHKKTISYCVKDVAGEVLQEGTVAATRVALAEWMRGLPEPWTAALEATLFSGWVYDELVERAAAVKVAHPLMLRAIAASKKKNDRIDARKIADCLRCDFLPECYMAPAEVRERRRGMRYRNLLVRQMVQLKNKTAGLLMETGVSYNKAKLHRKGYFAELLETSQEISKPLRPLLEINREMLVRLAKTERALLRTLACDELLASRVERLRTIPGIGAVTALTWALEMGEVKRFASLKQAVSYCGLCSGEKSSAGVARRTPLSKQRNKHVQQVLIEAAKLAPYRSPELALLREKELRKGDRNRATLAVARKLVSYLLAVDRRERPFVTAGKESEAA